MMPCVICAGAGCGVFDYKRRLRMHLGMCWSLGDREAHVDLLNLTNRMRAPSRTGLALTLGRQLSEMNPCPFRTSTQSALCLLNAAVWQGAACHSHHKFITFSLTDVGTGRDLTARQGPDSARQVRLFLIAYFVYYKHLSLMIGPVPGLCCFNTARTLFRRRGRPRCLRSEKMKKPTAPSRLWSARPIWCWSARWSLQLL